LATIDDASEKTGEKTNHIPGIYNYCDRWCERCSITARCLNFEMRAEKFGDLENVDITNEVFWQKLSQTFAETLSMLKEMAAEKGIDLDSIQRDDEDGFERRLEDPSVVLIISHMAESYITMVDEMRSSPTKAFARDVYSFWQPLDSLFIDMLVGLSRRADAEFCSLFWMKYLYGHIDYNSHTRSLAPQQLINLSEEAAGRRILENKLDQTGQLFKDLI